MKKLILLCSAAAVLPTAAYAQSTGSIETEKDTIVVTGTRLSSGIGGIVVQDSTKAKGLVTQELIAKQSPGQTVLNSINLIPGVNFTNSDAYGSSGGNIRIRGFDGNRVSLTFDGIPLNDSGNYAIYSNQQLDPELVEQVNVNLGATDIDSPTASAAGGTVNYRSLIPSDKMGVRVNGSLGSFDYRRVFGLFQTGEFTSFGTKAWVSASRNKYDHWRGPGKIAKWQINGKIYQPLGGNGDFVSIAGHYNENRNNNYNNPNLTDLRGLTGFGSSVVPSTMPASGYAVVGDYTDDQWYTIDNIAYTSSCTRATPVAGTAQNDGSSCTNYIGTQINPSNTGNIRGQSRFTLADGLVLTVDPTFQYTLANGGTQSTTLRESDNMLKDGVVGSAGVDLNGDGDKLDTVVVGRPSITNTRRYTVLSSLVWKPDANNTIRVAYSYDRAHHRQTGEYSRLDAFGNVTDPFFGRNGDPILTAANRVLQNRDRTSIALLNQLSAQYIGKFFDSKLRVEVGVRSPWFKRDLDQHCYTPAAGSGFPVCVQAAAVGSTPSSGWYTVPNSYIPAAAGILGTPVYAPFKASYKYHKLLPSAGLTFAVTDDISVFGSYAKGFSAPRTDNLYRSAFIGVQPETTNSFDLGFRYSTRMIQSQATLWKIDYKNRIVSSYDPATNISIDRNVGKVKSWGFDGSLGIRPSRNVSLLGLLSYTNAKLQQDIVASSYVYVPAAIAATSTTAAVSANAAPPAATGQTYYCPGLPTTLPTSGINVYNICAKTAGKFVVETPKWQYGGRAEFRFKPVSFGVQVKYVGDRWATDVNDVKSKSYTIADFDARLDLSVLNKGLDKSYFQLNVNNVFNQHAFGNLSTSIYAYGTGNSAPRFTPISTRSVTGTLNFGF